MKQPMKKQSVEWVSQDEANQTDRSEANKLENAQDEPLSLDVLRTVAGGPFYDEGGFASGGRRWSFGGDW